MAEEDEGGEHEEAPGNAGGTGGGDAQGGGLRLSPEDRESIVSEVVAQLRGALGGDGGSGDGGGEGDGASGPPAGGRLIDQEAWFEQVVRRELDKVRTAEDLGNLKEEVKKIVERPPRQYRRVTQMMWGVDPE